MHFVFLFLQITPIEATITLSEADKLCLTSRSPLCTTCDTLAEDDVIFGEELREETPPPGDYMEEGEEAEEFGFVGKKKIKKIEKLTTVKRFTEIEGGDDRERRAALLDWDGDYTQFQGDEVRK